MSYNSLSSTGPHTVVLSMCHTTVSSTGPHTVVLSMCHTTVCHQQVPILQFYQCVIQQFVINRSPYCSSINVSYTSLSSTCLYIVVLSMCHTTVCHQHVPILQLHQSVVQQFVINLSPFLQFSQCVQQQCYIYLSLWYFVHGCHCSGWSSYGAFWCLLQEASVFPLKGLERGGGRG